MTRLSESQLKVIQANPINDEPHSFRTTFTSTHSRAGVLVDFEEFVTDESECLPLIQTA